MKNRILKTALVCGAAGVMLLGGTMAYLTDYDQAVNEFTVGKVEIELTEPDWKPEENTDITPGQEIDKNPMVTNTGINDAFVYLQVAIPTAEVITADVNGNRNPEREQELFTFTKKDGWELISEDAGESEKIYTYAYNKVLAANQQTGSLFDTVVFANVIEGELDTAQLSVPVRAYAIQTANTGGDAASVVEQAKTAYLKYVNQNKNQDGAVM